MSKTIRYKGGHVEGSREHVMHHKYDGHKLATQVNKTNYDRHAHPVVLRTGIRGK